jgi:hypothetical protein
MSEETPSSKKASVKKKVVKKKAAASQAGAKPVSAKDFNGLLDELRKDRESRDKQFAEMAKEIRSGFQTMSDYSMVRHKERSEEFGQLVSGIEQAFGRAESVADQRDEGVAHSLKALSETILLDHQNTQKEVQEHEKLQDKKLNLMGKEQEQQSRRLRMIAIPATILAVFAVLYMFYMVSVMEKAITSMSQDVQGMRGTMAEITTEMQTMREDTRAMSTNMGYMTQEMSHMNRSVAPAMQGIRRTIPWSP